MKVEGPGKTSGPKAAGKAGAKKSAGDTGFSGLIDEAGEAQGSAATGNITAIAQLDALLSLQESQSGTSEEAARKAKKRGMLLLDQLDQIKIGLLTGGVPKSSLQQLKNLLHTKRDEVMDPKLKVVLDEVDLRVQVELAKLGEL